MNIKFTKKRIAFGIIVVVIVAIAGTMVKARNKPIEVKITEAKVRDIVKTISLSGIVEADKSVNLSFATAGTISKILVSKEDKVEKNQILANLDTSDLYNTYLSKKALYEKAKQQLETFKELYKDDPDTAKIHSDDIYWSTYKEYLEDIESTKATADVALNAISDAYIKSPIDGTVTKVEYEEGEYASAGSTIIQVVDLSTLYFDVDVGQEDIGQISIGQEVKIDLDTYPNVAINGKVIEVFEVPITDASGNNVYEVKIAFMGNNLPKINLGMEGSASVILENKISRLSIDASAIIEKGTVQNVYVVKDGKARILEIRSGFEGDTFIEIEEGLKEGDKVILSPIAKITPGKNVIENGF